MLRRALALCSLLLPLAAATAAQSITAVVDRNEVTLDDQVVLQVTITGTQSARPELPELPDFEVTPVRGASTSMSIVNGQTTVSVTYSYLLTPRRTGELRVGAATVELEGRTLASEPFTVRVLPADSETSSRDLFITVAVSTETPYLGQQVVYTWRLLRRVSITDAQLSTLEFPGFVVEELGELREYETTVDGQRYAVHELRRALFPQEEGELTIPGPRLTCQVLSSRSGRRGRLIDDFFGRRTTAERRALRTPEVMVTVRPLPAAPAGFSGLVGSFDLSGELSKTRLEVGESTTLTLSVAGNGNARMIPEPELPELPDFKVYDDKPAGSIQRSGRELSGKRVFQKALVPLAAGELTVPAVRLTYFDPETGRYRTDQAGPFRLAVAPAEGREELRLTEAVAPTTGKVAVQILADDILPLHKGLAAALGRPLLRPQGGGWLWLGGALLLPPLGFVALRLAEGRRRRFARDAGLRKRHGALKRALAGAREVEAVAAAGRDGEAARLAYRTLRAYVGDKLNVEGAALTAAETDVLLRHHQVDEELVQRTHRLLDRLEAAQYGAGRPAGEAEPVRELPDLLRRLEEQIR